MNSNKRILKLLNKREIRIFEKLNTPNKIQDYLNRLPINFEEDGETYRSPREVIEAGKAHCFEAAVFAAACLYFHARESLLLDLKTSDIKKDADHTVALFSEGKGKNKRWGAISKTNHAVLRWRDPIYINPRELAVSYFHEYFLGDGKKTLISYSLPYDIVKEFGIDWIVLGEDLDYIAEALDKSKHIHIYPKSSKKFIRKASQLEIKASLLEEWSPPVDYGRRKRKMLP